MHITESVSTPVRKYTIFIFGLLTAFENCALAVIAYLLPNWKHLMLVTSLPCLLYAIFLYFVLPESFHYVVTKEKKDDLNRWIKNANRFSSNPRKDLTADVIIDAHQKSRGHHQSISTKRALLEMFKKKIIIVYMLIFAYLWTCDSGAYYGISLISTLLSGVGSKYWNYALIALVDMPAYVIVPLLLDFMGRKLLVSTSHFLTAGAFLGAIFIGDGKLSFVLWLIGKFGKSFCI